MFNYYVLVYSCNFIQTLMALFLKENPRNQPKNGKHMMLTL